MTTTPETPLSIVIVDDDQLATKALATIVGGDRRFRVMAIGHSEEEAVALHQTHRPDLMLLDIRLNRGSGLSAARRILAVDKDAAVVLLSTFLDRTYVVDAIRIGVRGYLLKQRVDDLLPALSLAASGRRVFDPDVAVFLAQALAPSDDDDPLNRPDLSDKDRELIALVAEGMNTREVAMTLHLSEGTVRNQMSKILAALNLRDRTQLVVYRYRGDIGR